MYFKRGKTTLSLHRVPVTRVFKVLKILQENIFVFYATRFSGTTKALLKIINFSIKKYS